MKCFFLQCARSELCFYSQGLWSLACQTSSIKLIPLSTPLDPTSRREKRGRSVHSSKFCLHPQRPVSADDTRTDSSCLSFLFLFLFFLDILGLMQNNLKMSFSKLLHIQMAVEKYFCWLDGSMMMFSPQALKS